MLSPDQRSAERRIIHIDMDAFYASVEQRDDPTLRDRPVAVGGSRARGVVAAASYEARRFGVHSAMPSVTAKRKCPELVFVPPRFDIYRAVSRQIHGIFSRYTPLIQPLSLDEAYLDVTIPLLDRGSTTAIARELKAVIRAETGLTASAGVSYNKFLAKLASDHHKPDGLFVITPKMGPAFVEDLPVLASLWEAYTKSGQAGRTVTVKVKFADFQQITRSRSLTEPIASRDALDATSFDLLRPHFPPRVPVRLLGVTISGFDSLPRDGGAQLLLALFQT